MPFSWLFKVWTRDTWQGRYKTKRSEPRGFKIKVSWRKYCNTYRGFIKGFKINKKLKISVCFNLKVINVHIYVFTIIIMAIIQSKRQGRFLLLTTQHNRTTVVWKEIKKKPARNLYAGLFLVFLIVLIKRLACMKFKNFNEYL